MSTTLHKNWNSQRYLDALGSAAVIAVAASIFLAAATFAITEPAPQGRQSAGECPDTHHVDIEYTDQRPGAPPSPRRNNCA